MSKEYTFNAKAEIEHIVNWIKNYFVENGTPQTKAIIGISGGKDSTIAAALLVRALGPGRVVGVMMPEGEQKDINDAIEVCTTLGILREAVNIKPITDALYSCLAPEDQDNPAVYTNVPPRIRMTVLYALAAVYGARVCNTGNRSELYVGYTTKYGDLAGDFALLKNYTVSEVLAIGAELEEIPDSLVFKAPADGLTGKTDEDKLGFKYSQVDNLLLHGVVPDMAIYEKIKAAHNRNTHKNCINPPAPLKKDAYKINWTIL